MPKTGNKPYQSHKANVGAFYQFVCVYKFVCWQHEPYNNNNNNDNNWQNVATRHDNGRIKCSRFSRRRTVFGFRKAQWGGIDCCVCLWILVCWKRAIKICSAFRICTNRNTWINWFFRVWQYTKNEYSSIYFLLKVLFKKISLFYCKEHIKYAYVLVYKNTFYQNKHIYMFFRFFIFLIISILYFVISNKLYFVRL